MSQPTADNQVDILIVDDTPANLRLLSQLLSERGYSVRAVTSGMRALESVKIAPPTLILLDIRMPEMDGFQVCRKLKEDEHTRSVPVIFISALDDVQDKVQAFNAGGVDYITKPFHAEEVLARVEAHLTIRQLQKRLEDANQRYERELLLAGEIQTSLLPWDLPEFRGWQFSTCLRPARETSGDFFDVFRLPDGKLGLLVADVVDKGVCAALLMAISWDVIDTFVAEHQVSPADVFANVNQRLLNRLDGIILLTAFYAVLDLSNGELLYCNAGHVPPLLINGKDGRFQKLIRTGPPLGVIEETSWEAITVKLSSGGSLFLYTDGITDAQGPDGTFYGDQRLQATVQAHLGKPAEEMRDEILNDLDSFVSGAAQYDDIAFVIVNRQALD